MKRKKISKMLNTIHKILKIDCFQILKILLKIKYNTVGRYFPFLNMFNFALTPWNKKKNVATFIIPIAKN